MSVHVAVDAHDLVRDRRGIGRYVRALLTRFARRSDVRLTLVVRDPFPPRLRRPFAAALDAPDVRVTRHVPRDADVLWNPWNGTFLRSAVPMVATVHDVAPFRFPAGDPRRRAQEQAPFARTAATARTIVCDSLSTARDVEQHLGIAATRLRVVPLGVDAAFAPGPLDALPAHLRGRRYVLFVGAHEARKNVGTLAAAHRAAFPDGDPALVFTQPGTAAAEAIVCAGGDTATLIALYRAATIVAVPSLYEGFGLPALEAMACGAPVLAAHAAALPEVGVDAVRYVREVTSVPAWAAALRALADDEAARADLAQRGPQRAAAFTWERCADETLAILRG